MNPGVASSDSPKWRVDKDSLGYGKKVSPLLKAACIDQIKLK